MNAQSPVSCEANTLPAVDDVAALLRRCFAPIGQTVDLPLAQSCGRTLAAAVRARLSVPPCDRSAMDGYAYRFCDSGPRKLAGRALAGRPHDGVVAAGECVAIATGGSLPMGCDTVAMRENCRVTPHGVLVTAKAQGANVRLQGEDFHASEDLLAPGTRIGAHQIGLLAAAGVVTVTLQRRLRIALFSIGDELDQDAPGGIADANRPMLQALCEAQGMVVTDLGIIADCRDAVAGALARAIPDHDAILCSAGSCEGEEDHARGAVIAAGGNLMVAGVAIRPGKPVSFGSIGGKPFIALPGNPAAAYITFLAMGLPLLRHLSGAVTAHTPWQMARATFTHRKKPGLQEYVRIRMVHGADGILDAAKVDDDGSAMLRSLALADGLACFPGYGGDIREGDLIAVASFAALETS